MPDLPSAWQSLIQQPHQSTAWLWCWEITLDSTTVSTPTVAIVNNPTAVVVDGITFNPLPIIHTAITENAYGDLPQLEVQIDNTSKFLASYVEDADGFLERECTLRLTNEDDLSNFITYNFLVKECSITLEAAVLRLEVDNWFERVVPKDSYQIHRCRHQFGSARCGYLVSATGAYSDCDQSIQQCIERGDDMRSRNLGQGPPRSFGGFLGIPST